MLFYLEEAQRAGSPAVERCCGTGRSLIPVAQAGIGVVGLDRSESMLSIAKKHISGLSAATRKRILLVDGDTRSFSLEQRFNLIMVPNRSFLDPLTPDDQRQALYGRPFIVYMTIWLMLGVLFSTSSIPGWSE